MKDIAIYGAGGLGKEIAAQIKDRIFTERYNVIGFFDDGVPKGTSIHGLGEVIGGMSELNKWTEPLCIALCFGNPDTTCKVRHKIINPQISFPNLIINTSYFADRETISLGEGNLILGFCEFTVNVRMGDFNLFNGHVTVGHDTKIGNYNVFMPGSRISGEVEIGDSNLIGAMSFVRQCLKIGSNVKVSPLSALLTKPKDGFTYMGNPAKRFI